jgi:hypothetical protein
MRFALALLTLFVAVPASAQASVEDVGGPLAMTDVDVNAAPAFYVTSPTAVVRVTPSDTAAPVTTLRRRDGVRVLARSAGTAPADTALDWRLVQAGTARGYVRDASLSNIWIRVDKSERTTFVYRGAELLRTLPADVSVSPEDKVRRSDLGETDHYRIPEGTFFVTRLNPNSEYYRAFVLSYPGPVHALRGVQNGIITQAQYEAIVRADAEGLEPPMGTLLGGLIEIHGHGSGRRRAWTRGCVALRNVHMDELWEYVEVGTPVVIEP